MSEITERVQLSKTWRLVFYDSAPVHFHYDIERLGPDGWKPTDEGFGPSLVLTAYNTGRETAQSRIATLEAQVEQYRAALDGLKDDGLARLIVAEGARPSNMRIGQVREIRWWLQRVQDTVNALSAPAPTTDLARLRAIEKAAKALRVGAGAANVRYVNGESPFGVLNSALCAYDAALAALEPKEAPDA